MRTEKSIQGITSQSIFRCYYSSDKGLGSVVNCIDTA